MAYQYDAKRGRLITAMSLASTVIPSVLQAAEFWLFFAFHLFVYRARGSADWQAMFQTLHLDWQFVKVITSMATLFEVFYANQCYTRHRLRLGD